MISKEDLSGRTRVLLASGAADIRRRETLRKASAKLIAFIVAADFPWLNPAFVNVTDNEMAKASSDEDFAALHLAKIHAAVAGVCKWVKENEAELSVSAQVLRL